MIIDKGWSIYRNVLFYTGSHPETKDEAWGMTLDKWGHMVDHAGVANGGGRTCGLCQYYYCSVCPVSLAGYSGCNGTPYMDYIGNPTALNAQRELDFLLDIKAREPKDV